MNEEEVAYQDPRSALSARFNVWSPEWPGAVLNADEIRFYCEEPTIRLVSPFNSDNLKAASYHLTLGEEAHVGGKNKRVTSDGIELEPHQVAVLVTAEQLRMPRFLIGRWNLRVRKVYEGLLWTGGAQVDPGWTGRLYCPVYNLANKSVWLKAGEAFFTVDFVRVAPFLKDNINAADPPSSTEVERESKARKWFPRPERTTLDDHDIHRIQSAPYERLAELAQVKQDVKEARAFSTAFIGFIIGVLAFMVAALSIINAGPYVQRLDTFGSLFHPTTIWSVIPVVSSGLALLISAAAAVYCRHTRRS